MKGEPAWGKHKIDPAQLGIRRVLRRAGDLAGCLQTLRHRRAALLDTRGRQLETVVQLEVRKNVELDVSDLPAMPCPTCGRSKYSPNWRGMFPALRRNPSSAMVKSVQYFGSGAMAYHGTIVSGALRKAIVAADPRAGSFRPAKA